MKYETIIRVHLTYNIISYNGTTVYHHAEVRDTRYGRESTKCHARRCPRGAEGCSDSEVTLTASSARYYIKHKLHNFIILYTCIIIILCNIRSNGTVKCAVMSSAEVSRKPEASINSKTKSRCD